MNRNSVEAWEAVLVALACLKLAGPLADVEGGDEWGRVWDAVDNAAGANETYDVWSRAEKERAHGGEAGFLQYQLTPGSFTFILEAIHRWASANLEKARSSHA